MLRTCIRPYASALLVLHALLAIVCTCSSSSSSTSISFLALGDWGIGGNQRRLASGGNNNNNNNNNDKNDNGKYLQVDVAKAMATIASKQKISFIESTGDNFYNSGVSSTSDSLWTSLWRNIYFSSSSSALNGIPWYSCLGNHDYAAGQAGISAQTQRTFAYPNQEWRMYGTNYSVLHEAFNDDGTTAVSVVVVHIDTQTLAPSENSCCNSNGGVSSSAQAARIKNQLANIEKMLIDAQGATWIIVSGHYPVFSSSEHSDTQELIGYLEPMLAKYQVDAYISGHDHCLQHLQSQGMNYFVSGGGSMQADIETTSKASLVYGYESSGFALFTASANTLTAQFISTSASTLYLVSLQRKTTRFAPTNAPTRGPWIDPILPVTEEGTKRRTASLVVFTVSVISVFVSSAILALFVFWYRGLQKKKEIYTLLEVLKDFFDFLVDLRIREAIVGAKSFEHVRAERIRVEAREQLMNEAQHVYNENFGPRSPLNNKLQHVVYDHFGGEVGDGVEEQRARVVWQGIRAIVDVTEETREQTLELAHKTYAFAERGNRKYLLPVYEQVQSNGSLWLEEAKDKKKRILQSSQVRQLSQQARDVFSALPRSGESTYSSAWCVARLFVSIYVQIKDVIRRTFVAARGCFRSRNVQVEATAKEEEVVVEEEQEEEVEDTKTHFCKRLCMCWLQATRHPARNMYNIVAKRRSNVTREDVC